MADWGWLGNGTEFTLLALAGLGIALHFGHCFTRDLPCKDGEISAELRWIFRYAYGFLGIALLASLAPFVAPKDTVMSGEKWAGVVGGCQLAEDGYGSELTRCEDDGSDQQWLLQFGSRLVGSEVVDEDATVKLAEKARAACTVPDGWMELRRELKALGRSDGEALVSTLQNACAEDGNSAVEDMAAVLREQDVTVKEQSVLTRGLVVPLYVLVLAVFGATVGMSRRIPEIQRAAAASAKEQDTKLAISAIEARERVMFQIMQVLAAPLIAITAFAAFEPDTVTAAVLIGFASGFASETMLMKLRQASDAVVGQRPQPGVVGTPDGTSGGGGKRGPVE